MNYRVLLILLTGLWINGCKNSSNINSSVDTYNIDRSIIKTSAVKLTDLLKDYRFVSLQTSPDCVIGQIKKLVVRDGIIYVFDSSNSGRILLFSGEGNFLSKIDGRGKGPGEYVSIRDFSVSKSGDLIYVLTGNDIVNIYKDDCSFLKALNIGSINKEPNSYSLLHILAVEDALVFGISSYSNFSYLATSLNGKIRGFYHQVPSKAGVSQQLNYGLPNSTFVKRVCDTIFKIDKKGGLSPYKSFNFGKDQLSFKEWDKLPFSANGWGKQVRHPYFRVIHYVETVDFFVAHLILYDDGSTSYILFGNHKGGDVKIARYKYFNDQLLATFSYPFSVIPEDNTICCSIYPVELHERHSKIDDKELDNYFVLDSLCKQSTIEDNPIIAFYKLNIN